MADTSTWVVLGRLVLSLAVVLGLVLVAAAIAKRKHIGGKPNASIEVLARASMGRTSSVQVVRVGDRALVLGVTEQSITYLTEGDPADYVEPRTTPGTALDITTPPPAGTQAPGGTAPDRTRMSVIDSLRELTVRR